MAVGSPARAAPTTGAAPNPYAPRVRTRYLQQIFEFGPTIWRWRRALLALRHRPHRVDRAAALRYAWDHVPFWRDRFAALGIGRHALSDPAIWPALPVTTRADLQTHRVAMFARGVDGRALADAYHGCTSGSTGEPVRYRMSAVAYHSFYPVVDLALSLYGVRRRPRPGRGGIALLDALGHSPTYGAWLPMFHGTRFEKLSIGEAGWRSQLRALDPVVITGDPDSLAGLLDTDARPGLVLSSAFAMPASLADALRRHLGCPVVEYYSAQEVGPMALRGPTGHWSVLSPFVCLEDEALPDGGHRLLVTDFRNRLMPLIRYAVGDLGQVHDWSAVAARDGGAAPSLRAPVLEGFTGRVSQRFLRPGGGRFDPAGLAPTLARLPIDEWRVSQTAGDTAALEYRGARALTEAEQAVVRTRLSELAGAPMRLITRRVLTTMRAPGVKPRPFVALGEVLDSRAAGHRDAPVAGRPHRVYVAVTNACNRACPWCSTYSSPARQTYITREAFAAALPSTGAFELQLEGGEPTLHPELFDLIALAEATGRCAGYVLCTNGVRIPRGADRLRCWLDRFPRPLTLKISVNHHLVERDANHVDAVRRIAEEARSAAVEVVINIRRRPGAPDADRWVSAAVDEAGLSALANDFPLQRYGLARDDESMAPPYLAGTDFTLVNPDGQSHGVDLVARSEAMGALP